MGFVASDRVRYAFSFAASELTEQMGRQNERLAARVRQYLRKGGAPLNASEILRLDNRDTRSNGVLRRAPELFSGA